MSVMSRADKRVLVYRNGVEIGRAKLAIDQPGTPLGTHAFIMQDGWGEGNSTIVRTPRPIAGRPSAFPATTTSADSP